MPHAYITRETFNSRIVPILSNKPMTPRMVEGLRAVVNQTVWRIACRLLDGSRIIAGSHVVKPEDVYNLMRVSLLMHMPLEDDPISRRLSSKAAAKINKGMQTGGGGTVLPGQYFGASGGGGGGTVMAAQYFGASGGGGGGTVMAAQYFGAGAVSEDDLMNEAAMQAVLKEYRSRVTSTVLISEAARGVMRKHIEANVLAIIHECKGRPGALKGISAKWVTLHT